MIKGVRIGGVGTALSYLDTLEVPIIGNTPYEADLQESMAQAMAKYPNAAGILVRRHGVYVWGAFAVSPPSLFRSRDLRRDGLGKGQGAGRVLGLSL